MEDKQNSVPNVLDKAASKTVVLTLFLFFFGINSLGLGTIFYALCSIFGHPLLFVTALEDGVLAALFYSIIAAVRKL